MLSVYTEAQLTTEQLSPHRIRLGVIGNPIAHSKSPQMQQAALDTAGIDCRYIRILAETAPQGFENVLSKLAACGFIGANVTVPFKKQAFAIATQADALSSLCGAANTLVRKGNEWHCHNTDGPGFERAILELSGKQLRELNILILGACGGAGSALAAQCALAGCSKLTLVNRPRPELQQMQAKLAPVTQGELRAAHFDSPQLPQLLEEAQLIVNATSLGLAEGDPMPIPTELLHSGQLVYDIVTHDTPLRRCAEAQGCLTDNGIGMLLWQGAYAFEHWFGYMPDVAAMRAGLLS